MKKFWIVRAIVIGIIVDAAVSCSLWGTRSLAFSGEVNRVPAIFDFQASKIRPTIQVSVSKTVFNRFSGDPFRVM